MDAFIERRFFRAHMEPLEELSSLVTGELRVVVIAERDVDLRPSAPPNRLFLLKIAEGSHAAGGRGGGFGERRVVGVSCFEGSGGTWAKAFETPRESDAARFEVPYYVSRIPFVLADGTETMGYGVIEPDLVRQMASTAGLLSIP